MGRRELLAIDPSSLIARGRPSGHSPRPSLRRSHRQRCRAAVAAALYHLERAALTSSLETALCQFRTLGSPRLRRRSRACVCINCTRVQYVCLVLFEWLCCVFMFFVLYL